MARAQHPDRQRKESPAVGRSVHLSGCTAAERQWHGGRLEPLTNRRPAPLDESRYLYRRNAVYEVSGPGCARSGGVMLRQAILFSSMLLLVGCARPVAGASEPEVSP